MATKFPPGQDMDNVSPKDLEEAKTYTKERKAYKDASKIGSEPKENYMTPEPKENYMTPEPKQTSKASRASRVNAMGDTYKKGGMTASRRADGCATKGKTKGRFV
jgi:hypothetical protein